MADNTAEIELSDSEVTEDNRSILDTLDIDYWAMLRESRVL